MLNMIKMDVYRMFRTKSMYVIWIILLASALLTSFLSKIDYDAVNKEWERQQAVESQADTDGQTVDVVNAQDIEEQQADNSNKEQLSQQNEQLSQQSEQLSQQSEQLSQQSEQLSQQSEQLSQQSEQLRNMAKALFANGMTEEQISAMTGIDAENVAKLLN